MKQNVVKAHLVQRVSRKRAKRREKDEDEDRIEQLEKEVRELKSINRSLLRQLKKLSKGINKQEYEEALDIIENGSKDEKNNRKGTSTGDGGSSSSCPECSREGLREISIAGRKFLRCSVCEYKSGRIR